MPLPGTAVETALTASRLRLPNVEAYSTASEFRRGARPGRMLGAARDRARPAPDRRRRHARPASHGGPLRQELSNAIVALFKEYFGRGPADCRTYLEPDLVVVVMTGGYHAAEQTLFEAGKWHEVRSARMSWQDTMEVRFVETIERLTHRRSRRS